MSTARYTVLGLARPRSAWFADLGRWATSGSAPLDFVRCVSPEEVRARLASSRPFSALLVDGTLPGVDRDLLDTARSVGCAPLVVSGTGRDWVAMGAAGTLPVDFGRGDLLALLSDHAPSLAEVRSLATIGLEDGDVEADWSGRLVAVTGPGGTGASVVAQALAQCLAEDPRSAGHVLLADLARRADQAMYHTAPDVVPGVSELVEAHRAARLEAAAVRTSTFAVAARGYNLLLGLRRQRDWAALRPRATDAAVAGLLQAFRQVVADVDADVEGEAETGVIETEDRNLLARTVLGRADAVVVVGHAGTKGLHSSVRTIEELVEFGVEAARLVPVLNHAPRSPRARAELTKALGDLGASALGVELAAPLFLPSSRRLEAGLRDVGRLPTSLGSPVCRAVVAICERQLLPPTGGPRPVTPGSLGGFASDRAAS
ncbi:MAG: hypothetical protein GEV08_15330 [Acidimicrobiia bacterium]|nr:hypothetical protein [Acidimicrobiia bacterium]